VRSIALLGLRYDQKVTVAGRESKLSVSRAANARCTQYLHQKKEKPNFMFNIDSSSVSKMPDRVRGNNKNQNSGQGRDT
jgi:hypothetical protein